MPYCYAEAINSVRVSVCREVSVEYHHCEFLGLGNTGTLVTVDEFEQKVTVLLQKVPNPTGKYGIALSQSPYHHSTRK